MTFSPANSSLMKAKTIFPKKLGGTPRVFHARGRVKLTGEHRDYNGLFVLPVAAGLSAWVAVAPSGGASLRAFSESLNQSAAIDLREKKQKFSHTISCSNRGGFSNALATCPDERLCVTRRRGVFCGRLARSPSR
jgi:galactokinase